MEITLQRETLLKPLQWISGVVERKQTLPILANVLLTATDEGLTLTATDTEIEMIGRVAVENVKTPGTTTVSARKLFDICRSLPEDATLHLSVNAEQGQMLVRSGSSRFSLATLPAKEFPSLENCVFTHEFSLPQNQFHKHLSKVYFAMGQQDVRHYLNGILLDINRGILKCVATDGHRLALSSAEHAGLEQVVAKVILPRKSVLELVRLLHADDESEITISLSENHFRLATAEFTFTSKLINAQYPDYERLIPRKPQNTVVAARDALKQAFSRAAILSNEKFRAVRLLLEEDKFRIIANNMEQEEAEEIVSLNYQGNGMEIGFNVAYLLDILSALVSETVHWSFSDPNAGVLIKSHHEDDSLYVVMPMKL